MKTYIKVLLIACSFFSIIHQAFAECIKDDSYFFRIEDYDPCTGILRTRTLISERQKFVIFDDDYDSFYGTNTITIGGVNINSLKRKSSSIYPLGFFFEYEYDNFKIYPVWRVTEYYVPNSIINNQPVLSIRNDYNWRDCARSKIHTISPKFVRSTSTPSSVSVSKGQDCDKITLSWTNSENLTDCPEEKTTIEIQRKTSTATIWAPHKTLPVTANTLVDMVGQETNNIESAIDYDYRIRYSFQPYDGFDNFSNYVVAEQGYTIKPLPSPFDLQATDDNCDNAITISWQWNGSNTDLSYFRIQRKENTSSASWQTLPNVSGDKRSYKDSPSNYNYEYRYRIYAINSCGDPSLVSSEVIGIKPGTPPIPSGLFSSSTTNSITINWSSTGGNTTGFLLERSVSGGGSPLVIDGISMNAKSYVDMDVDQCVTYTYKVRAVSLCYPDGHGSNTTSTQIQPDLSGAFANDGTGFTASKGYFTNKIELTWTNNNERQTNRVKIYRRVLGDGLPLSLLASENDDSGIYNDNDAEAGILYEYEIQAEAPCENSVAISNRVSTVGFRSKQGQVNGNVSYTGGVAVKDAKIIATRDEVVVGKSLNINGGELKIESDSNQAINDELLIETWVKPSSLQGNFSFVLKPLLYALYKNGDDVLAYVYAADGSRISVSVPDTILPLNQWTHLAAQLRNDSLHLYVNGETVASRSTNKTSYKTDLVEPIYIGKGYQGPGFDGHMKEVRIWNKSFSDQEFSQNYNIHASGRKPGMIAYLPMDEGVGGYAYDRSQIGPAQFNRNHAEMTSEVLWSDDTPSEDQLSHAAYTDEKGNYILRLPYTNAGETYELTPVFKTHQFDPSSRILFVGDASSVINGIDFEDISSFRVTGTVFFNNTNCSSKDVFIKVDGVVSISAGEPIKTAPDGSFELQVPIGNHVISLEKNGHVFNYGRFPLTGTYDFQEAVTGIEFKDSTTRRVVGRVVGGRREGDKAPGLSTSINNIGRAQLVIDPSATCGWLAPNDVIREDTSIYTDATSGEYFLDLPPMEYVVKDVDINSAPSIDFGAARILDLTNVIPLRTSTDSVYNTMTNELIRVDSTNYNVQHDYIYRTTPSIEVEGRTGTGPLTGENTYTFSHSKYGEVEIDLEANPLPYPVFLQNRNYSALISTFEEYTNMDAAAPIMDRVPVTDGLITINNELSTVPTLTIDLSQDHNYDGDTVYVFKGGQPNITTNSTIPEYSFTRPFKVDLSSGAFAATWAPNVAPSGGDQFYRGYLLGTKDVEQSDFTTQGPELVDYILRDPPGSQSFASREVGQSTSTEKVFNWNVAGEINTSTGIVSGANFSAGIGFSTITDIETNALVDVNTRLAGGNGKSTIETITSTSTWQTSADPLFAGAQSDLFIGSSRNYLFGVATSLVVVPDSVCTNASIECFGSAMTDFRLAREKNLALGHGDFATTFVYTATHIETYEIPQLEEIRDFFLSNNARYTSHLTADHPCFGYNNDDVRLGTSSCPNTPMPTIDPLVSTREDSDGGSYTFNSSTGVTDSIVIDSVRMFNQQIRLWKSALAGNEKDKLSASNKIDNFSFAGGGSSFSNSVTNTRATSKSRTFELVATQGILTQIQAKIGGNGIRSNIGISLTEDYTELTTNTDESVHTVGYTIADDSEWDDFTFDVYSGSSDGGPIFKTLAGRTSCPHEGTIVSKYYQPGTILNPGTIQLEQPEISVSPSVLYNVPQDGKGVFTMTLSNNNQVGEGWEYATQLRKESNPNSANVNIGSSDDLTARWTLQPGTSISRDLFVEIGNGYDYDSLLVIMHSTCQYQGGISAERDIVDSAYFSIHFIPECTEIALSQPGDQWVLNNSFKDTLDIIGSDYDINYLNLESFQFEYKPSNQADWIRLEKYYKDTTGLGDPTAKSIPTSTASTLFQWDVTQIPDGSYDLRATTDCQVATDESPVYGGYMDRVNPHPFGTPSPADGVLDPDDDILLKLNEPLDIGSVTSLNFDVRGVLNGSVVRHETSLGLDGIDDYAEIVPYQLQKRSLTIEAWVKRDGNGAQTIFSQSVEDQDQLFVGFDSGDKLRFQLGNIELLSDASITDNKWHHIAVTYDRANTNAEIYIDFALDATDNNFDTYYTGSGTMYIGKDAANASNNLQGFIHGLRLWSKTRGLADIAAKGNKLLSGREAGLIGCWDLDEGHGLTSIEKVRGRNASIYGATWAILPENHAYEFDGVDDLLFAQAGSLGFDDETDLTIEAWFKTSASSDQTIVSNGKADGSQTSDAWEVYVDNVGAVIVENDGNIIQSSTGWNDGNWHHVAIVIERTKSASLYIDGDLSATSNSSEFKNFVGSTLTVGATAWTVGTSVNIEKYFNGQLDDIRIWNTARQSEQVKRDRLFQLGGDELGLQAYYPFDGVTEQLGVMLRTPTLQDESMNDFDFQSYGATMAQYVLDAPPIKLPRLIEKVNFTYSLNNDEIYVALNELPARIENTVIDVTVRGFKDEAGNVMQSPKTWTAFIDKNQVFWENEYFTHEMKSGDTYSFTSKIINTGGRQERYSISNLPSWIVASHTTGFIDPNSNIEVTFTLDPFVNIGEYEQDIYVSTESFGFNERLLFDLKVSADPPDWNVDPDGYAAAMSYIGEIFIDDLISTDAKDIVIAMINDSIRGVGNVQYSPGTGKHLVYLDVYGHGVGEANSNDGDTIVFQLWDASENKIYSKVLPVNELFREGELRGSLSNPVAFKSSNEEEITYHLKRGWNWISFPVVSEQLRDVDKLLEEVGFEAFDRVTNHKETIFQDASGTWKGEPDMLTNGMNLRDGYRLYVSAADTFSYNGKYRPPSGYKIPLSSGWTSIGMIAEDPIDVTTALANLEPQNGDWIKSQKGFSVYEDGFGWNGSIQVLSPRSSYMIKMAARDTLIYPNIRGLKSRQNKNAISQDALYAAYQVAPEMYDHSMSMVVAVDGYEEWDSMVLWYVAAYRGGSCQGINEISMDMRRKKRIGYLNVYGDIDDEITFKLISSDGSKIMELREIYTLESDGTLGLPSTPEILSLGYPCRSEINVGSNYQAYMDDVSEIRASKLVRLNSPTQSMTMLRIKSGEAIEVISGFESAVGNELELHIEPCER